MSYESLDLLEKASYLVSNKGDMSVELWNDRAQCVLSPILAKLNHEVYCNDKAAQDRDHWRARAEAAEEVCEAVDISGYLKNGGPLLELWETWRATREPSK